MKYRNNQEWSELVSKLKPGLAIGQVKTITKTGSGTVRLRLQQFGYRWKNERYWRSEDWELAISNLPPNLSVSEAAKKIGKSYCATLFYLNKFRYEFPDTRGQHYVGKSVLKPDGDYWNLTNAVIARKLGVSRERVRQVRKRLGISKVGAINNA